MLSVSFYSIEWCCSQSCVCKDHAVMESPLKLIYRDPESCGNSLFSSEKLLKTMLSHLYKPCDRHCIIW